MKSSPHTKRQLPSRLVLWFFSLIIVIVALAGADWLGIGRPFARTVSAVGVKDPIISPALVAGDTCATATAISPASLPFSTDGTTEGAANDIDPGLLGCAAGAGPDVVFSFTPAATDRYTIGVTPTGIGFDVSLYVVTDCANPATTCVAGANINGTSKGESVTPTLNAGTNYFIVVDGSSPGNFGPFHFSLRRGVPPNDTCASPTVIEASRLPFSASATTFGAANDLNPDVPCLRSRQSGSGADVVYQFTPADSQNYVLTVTPSGEYDTSIYIVTNCASLTGCSSADFGGAGVAETLRRNLTTGITYFIVVDGFGGDAGDFTIFLEPSIPLAPNPPSDLVAAAISATEVRLTWTDNSSNELGFRIERSLDGFAFNEIATVGSNETTFSDLAVVANTTYFYRVLSFNNFGNSAPSNIAGVTTPNPPPPPVPIINASPNPMEFGTVRTSLTLALTISNTGGANLVISSISDPAAPFSIVDKPAVPITVAPAGTFDLMVKFSPAATQLFTGSFAIGSNDAVTPSLVVNLRGTGTAVPVPNLDLSAVIINFPSGTSSTLVVANNTGDADLIISSMSSPALPFSVSGVPVLPAVFKPGEGFVMTVGFSPPAPGVYTSEMLLVCNDPDQLLTVFRLRGTSTPQDELFKAKAPALVTAIAGQSNTLNVIAANGTNTDIHWTATAVQGGVFTDRGNGRGDLVVTPAASATGRLLVTFTARDGQNRVKAVQSSITIVAASASHQARLVWTAPAASPGGPSNLAATDLSITPLSFLGDSIESESVEPEQAAGLIGYVIYRATTPTVPLSLANIVGIATAGQTSFTDNLPAPAGSAQIFYYTMTAFYGSGTESAASNVSSTGPQIIDLQFKKKGLRMQAAGSNITAGAVLIVDGRESFTLVRNGDLLIVAKTALSTPGGLKPAKVVTSGTTHSVQVRNANGALSASVSLTR
jgi:hypothetical protein